MSLPWRTPLRALSVCTVLIAPWIGAWAQEPGRHELRLQDLQGAEPNAQDISKQAISGDWIAEADIISAGTPARAVVMFAIRHDAQSFLAFDLGTDHTELIRHNSASPTRLAAYPGAGPLPWKIKVRRRGAYYFLEVNGTYLGFTFHPSGDLDGSSVLPAVVEPESTRLGVQFPSPGGHELRRFHARRISFGERMNAPVITPGPAGSWNQAEVFPGAVVEYNKTYYLYLNGTDWTSTSLEGGGHTRVGLASSEDLIHWKVDPRGVVFGLGATDAWDSTLVMVNGATRTPEGKFAITYMGFNGKKWSGIGLATADNPTGPFTRYAGNPVLPVVPNSWEIGIHEHALYRDKDRYILFYTGFDGKNGDRGGLAYSQDLIHWSKDPSNPVFLPEGPNRWSSLHLRPRTLFHHGQYFYLFHEGAGMRPKFSKGEGGVEVSDKLVFDSVGLARSKDLHHWESFPWNPAIAQTGDTGFDALWTGWPHAVLRPEGVFVFYAASDAWGFAKKQGRVSTGLMRFSYQELENWGQSIHSSGNH